MKKFKLQNSILAIFTILSMLAGYTQTVFAQEEVDDIEITGTIVSIDETDGSFVLETDTGEQYTVYPGIDFDFTSIQVDDLMKVEGTINEDGSLTGTETEVQNPDSDDQESDEVGDISVGYYCRQSEDQHPFGARLAEQYETDYSTLQAWFCDGSGWGEIMLAMKTSKLVGIDAAEMIAARQDGSGWGQIWQEAGLIGKKAQEEIKEQKQETKTNADKTPGPPEDKDKKPKKVK